MMMQVGRRIVHVLYLLSDDRNLDNQKDASSSSRDSGLSMTEKRWHPPRLQIESTRIQWNVIRSVSWLTCHPQKNLSFWDPEKRRLSGSNLDLCCVRLILCTDFTKLNHHPSPPMCRIRFVFTSKSKQQKNVQRFICFHRPWRETSRAKFFPEQKKFR